NLYHANLKNTNFKWADLENANLRYASLENADMGGTNLKNTILPDGFFSDNQVIQAIHLRGMKIPGLKI
ncbi:MAG: pentapeptide repeat-containing protein, partial [Lachnospiraceae bacterium]|nr:pentapeptide repeat-containing protein [Lachnospiraceae bacterium]